MNWYTILIIVALIIASASVNGKQFPSDFKFGAATAAYQIEGGWNADGKGPNIWDDFVHKHPELIANRDNCDVGPNSYEFYMDDIEAMKNLSMDVYRFSISWSRVLPTGDINNINKKGVEYYDKLINKLLENNIQPMVTMYHFDLPLALQAIGGFTSSTIVDYFEAYANLLFEHFGDRVKLWTTFNEPAGCCGGYAGGGPPMVNFPGIGDYACGHNILKSHAAAYHLYKNSYYDRFKGQVGIVLDSFFFYSDKNDSLAAELGLQFMLGRFAHPIFSANGNYPDLFIKRIGNNSKHEGRLKSRLPTFSDGWIKKIRGSADYLGLNYYSSRMVRTLDAPTGPVPSFEHDRGIKEWSHPSWKPSGLIDWHNSVPKGLGDILRWIKKEYNNPVVYVTENGWRDKGVIEDNDRVEYLHDHLQEILHVIENKQSDIRGYTVWSLIDNFEWGSGFTHKMGLYHINFDSPRRERTEKKSARFMRTVTTTRKIPNIQ